MTLEQLRDEVIRRGIESVGCDGRMKAHEKRGSVAGFERCRELRTPADFDRALRGLERQCDALRRQHAREDYWEKRYEQIQVEHVWEVLKVGLGIYPQYASKVMLYADIVGVAG